MAALVVRYVVGYLLVYAPRSAQLRVRARLNVPTALRRITCSLPIDSTAKGRASAFSAPCSKLGSAHAAGALLTAPALNILPASV